MSLIKTHDTLKLVKFQSATSKKIFSSPSSITCQKSKPYRTVKTVSISLSELKDKNSDLFAKIDKGFGPDGLGIISITDVPDFPVARQNLLQLANRVANLPDDVKSGLEDPESRYNFGWSHGKEKLESGKLDTFKGSFYANPILDVPTTDVSLIQRSSAWSSGRPGLSPETASSQCEENAAYIIDLPGACYRGEPRALGSTFYGKHFHHKKMRHPSYCGSNKWPRASLPELEIAFKELGKMMLDVGLKLAYRCDQYISKTSQLKGYEGLEKLLDRSRCHKGRLLYYFPKLKRQCLEDSGSVSSWCGWHTDYGSLTGLTSGMFTKDGVEIEYPDTAAGLYIKARDGEIVKVVFGEEEMAFQIGEATEILSEGRLCATPHCVQAPKGEDAVGVERSTFAMFMQPDWDEKLKFPATVHHHKELIPPNGSLTFGEYSETLVNKYYQQKS